MQRTGIYTAGCFCSRYNYDYSKYEPYIIPHRSDPKKLFCIVTMTSLNKVSLWLIFDADSGGCRACGELQEI